MPLASPFTPRGDGGDPSVRPACAEVESLIYPLLSLEGTKIFLESGARAKGVRADRAWETFFGTKGALVAGPGMPRFAEWLWDELGMQAGAFNLGKRDKLTIVTPPLSGSSLDFLLRLVSFWSNEIYVKKGRRLSKNLWKEPVVNVLGLRPLDGAERAQSHDLDEEGSVERNLMPTLGPGQAFYSVQTIKKGASTARMHSHSALDEYYLVLEGEGTLRFDGREIPLMKGDLVGKPAGPDASTHIIADRGEELKILDMEIWHQRAHFPKDFMADPDFGEIIIRGEGWDATIPTESLLSTVDSGAHYQEGYRRTRDGGWVPAKLRGHKKVRRA